MTSVLFLTTFVVPVKAQFYTGLQMDFGKNRVQYNNPFWSFYRFEKFDTYFYTNGTELAAFTARYADKAIRDMERRLDYPLDNKIQFVVFNKLSDLKQSNIGLMNEAEYNVGGITHIVGSKVFLYFDGSHANLQQQIRAGIAQVILDQMLFGGRITSMMKNSALLTLPDWYTKGLIAYYSSDWNQETDMHVRDGIVRGDYRRFSSLTGMEAVYAGHSIWKFVADKYGPSTLANIVYMTKVSKSVDNGFLFVLGISYKNLIREWLAWYQELYLNDPIVRQNPEGDRLLKRTKKRVVYQQFKISPDGNQAAWTTNDDGRWKIFLRDQQTGKTKVIKRSGQRLDEKADYSSPILSWHPSGKLLAVFFEYKGKVMMYFYTPEDEKFDKQRLFEIEKMLDASFSQNGRLIAMSVVANGQSDIVVYNMASHVLEVITKDIWDDINPRFIANSSEIIFSSNRPDDTLRYDRATFFTTAKDTLTELAETYDLFIARYPRPLPVFRRVTNTPAASETQAMEYDKRHFTYLSDENGIMNRFIARIDSTIAFIDTATHYRYYTTSFPVTDYARPILSHDVSRGSRQLTEIIFEKNRFHLLTQELVPASELAHRKLQNTYFQDQYLRELQLKNVDTTSTLSPEEIEYLRQKKNRQRVVRKMTNVLINEIDQTRDTVSVNIDNYSFGNTPGDSVKSDSSKFSLQPGFIIPRQENYNVEYFINQLVTQLDFNFLNATYQTFTGTASPIFLNAGLNALFKLGVIDLMEDYRITGGFRLSLDLDNNEFFLSFDNLKRRLDKTLIFHRQAVENLSEYMLVKVRTHDLQYVLKWPFSNTLALKGSGILRWDKTIYAATDLETLKEPSFNDYWAGLKAELIFDNTRPRGLNLYYGSRWKVFGEYYERITDKWDYLAVLGLDYRHYQKIHRTFIWANRLAASTSFGSSPLVYYLGGVDNWLIPKFNPDIQVDPEKNYAFQTIATNLRGFSQNTRNGNNFAVFNSELRFPLFRYFAKKPIKSEFLSNFQIVGFGDLGMAWCGWNPWSEENTIFEDIYRQGPITVTIRTKREPIVGGFGAGLRTRLLGYFIRLDYAWGVENMTLQKPMFYLSLTTDF